MVQIIVWPRHTYGSDYGATYGSNIAHTFDFMTHIFPIYSVQYLYWPFHLSFGPEILQSKILLYSFKYKRILLQFPRKTYHISIMEVIKNST